MGFFKEFKEFAVKGNVVDLAVGVVIGGAFGKIVTSLGHYLTNCVSKMTWVEQLKSFFINFKNTVCYERRIIFRRIFQAV